MECESASVVLEVVKTNKEMKKEKHIHKCWYCKERNAETSPKGIYCKQCRLRLAKGEIKSVLFTCLENVTHIQ